MPTIIVADNSPSEPTPEPTPEILAPDPIVIPVPVENPETIRLAELVGRLDSELQSIRAEVSSLRAAQEVAEIEAEVEPEVTEVIPEVPLPVVEEKAPKKERGLLARMFLGK